MNKYMYLKEALISSDAPRVRRERGENRLMRDRNSIQRSGAIFANWMRALGCVYKRARNAKVAREIAFAAMWIAPAFSLSLRRAESCCWVAMCKSLCVWCSLFENDALSQLGASGVLLRLFARKYLTVGWKLWRCLNVKGATRKDAATFTSEDYFKQMLRQLLQRWNGKLNDLKKDCV